MQDADAFLGSALVCPLSPLTCVLANHSTALYSFYSRTPSNSLCWEGFSILHYPPPNPLVFWEHCPQEQTPFSLECPRQSQGVRDILPRTRRLCGGQTTRVAHRGNGLLEPLALRCADTRPQPSCFTRGISEQAARGCPLLLVDLSHSRSQAPCDKMAGREGRV